MVGENHYSLVHNSETSQQNNIEAESCSIKCDKGAQGPRRMSCSYIPFTNMPIYLLIVHLETHKLLTLSTAVVHPWIVSFCLTDLNINDIVFISKITSLIHIVSWVSQIPFFIATWMANKCIKVDKFEAEEGSIPTA